MKVETCRSLATNDLTLKRLKDDLDFKAVFVGIGNPQPKSIPIFDGLTENQGFYTSKDFLPKVSYLSLKHVRASVWKNRVCMCVGESQLWVNPFFCSS